MWPLHFHLSKIQEGKERERPGHLHSYCSSSTGWGDDHLHAYSHLADQEIVALLEEEPEILTYEAKEGEIATPILTNLP